MSQQNNKPSICLLHGWGTASDIWLPFLDYLNKSFEVHNLALPGLGNNQYPSASLNLESALSELEAKIPDGSFLLGWSLGGLMATLLASNEQLKVRGLITIGFNPSFVQQIDWSAAMEQKQFDGFSNLLAQNSLKTLSRFYALQVQGGSDSKEILKLLKSIGSQSNPSHLSDNLSFLLRDCRSELANLQIPSVHIYGEFDQLVPVSVAELLSKLSNNLTVKVIDKAGHLPFLSDSSEIAQLIISFCKAKSQGDQ